MRLSDRGCEALRLHLLAPAGIWWRALAHGHGLPGALSARVGFSPKSEHIVSRGCRRSGGYLVRVARGIRGVRAKFNTDEKWGGGERLQGSVAPVGPGRGRCDSAPPPPTSYFGGGPERVATAGATSHRKRSAALGRRPHVRNQRRHTQRWCSISPEAWGATHVLGMPSCALRAQNPSGPEAALRWSNDASYICAHRVWPTGRSRGPNPLGLVVPRPPMPATCDRS